MGMECLLAKDKQYAKLITHTNMSQYYRQYGISWDDEMFDNTWEHFDNYEIFDHQQRVGVVRFSRTGDVIYLRDLQIEALYQNKGLGQQVIRWAKGYAVTHGATSLNLRVFPSNPAIALYKREGFTQVGQVNKLMEMTCPIA